MFAGRKLALTLAFTVLVALAFGISCRGFFTPPNLLTVAIQPASPQIDVGQSLTLQAFGTFDNNEHHQITSGVSWSSDSANVTIDPNTGVATGNTLGTATITAASEGISGTATATVIVGAINSLTIQPTNTWGLSTTGGSKAFTVIANGTQDVTTGATFTPSDTTDFSCTNAGVSPETCTATSGVPAGSYTITVTYPGTTIAPVITITVSP
jgi:Bacterial Ig-like domain (group 2)